MSTDVDTRSYKVKGKLFTSLLFINIIKELHIMSFYMDHMLQIWVLTLFAAFVLTIAEYISRYACVTFAQVLH